MKKKLSFRIESICHWISWWELFQNCTFREKIINDFESWVVRIKNLRKTSFIQTWCFLTVLIHQFRVIVWNEVWLIMLQKDDDLDIYCLPREQSLYLFVSLIQIVGKYLTFKYYKLVNHLIVYVYIKVKIGLDISHTCSTCV